MTASRITIVMLLVVAGAGLCVTISARRLRLARDERRFAELALRQSVHDAQEILNLRATRQTIESRQRPPQDVIAQVNATLAEVGIPGRCFKSLSPEGDTPVTSGVGAGDGPAGLKQQSLRLVLEALAPDQIGAWLAQWRSAQAIWTPSRIELVHNRATDQSGNNYDVTILLTALYLDIGEKAEPA